MHKHSMQYISTSPTISPQPPFIQPGGHVDLSLLQQQVHQMLHGIGLSRPHIVCLPRNTLLCQGYHCKLFVCVCVKMERAGVVSVKLVLCGTEIKDTQRRKTRAVQDTT